MRLSKWAKKYGISYTTAWRLWKKGQLNAFLLPTGTIIVEDDKNHGLKEENESKKKEN